MNEKIENVLIIILEILAVIATFSLAMYVCFLVFNEIRNDNDNQNVVIENTDSQLQFDTLDDYWLVEIVSREPFGDDGYYYQIRVVGTEEYGYQVSYDLLSVGELALAIEFGDNQIIMIDFNN